MTPETHPQPSPRTGGASAPSPLAEGVASDGDSDCAHRHLLLIGLRGSGKSTLAPLLAASLSRPWVDLDACVIEHLGVPSVSDAFRRFGEPAFRDAEVECLGRVLAQPPLILALGGGTAAIPQVQELLHAPGVRARASLAWLDASDATLVARIEAAERDAPGTRPRLGERGWLDEIRFLRAQRTPAFQRLAARRFETDRGDPAAVAAEIAAWFHEGSFGEGSFREGSAGGGP